jgi:alanine dehydrogenase
LALRPVPYALRPFVKLRNPEVKISAFSPLKLLGDEKLMKIAVPKDAHPGETRAALIPEHVAKLVKAGAAVSVESGLGQTLRIADNSYAEAGASIAADRNALIENADMILRIRKPLAEEELQQLLRQRAMQ